jgi:hypothetical protein
MTTADATFTDFLRNPREVTERLREGDVILHRRDGDDLRLSVESRAAATIESLQVVGRVLTDILADAAVRDRISDRAALPWVRFLPRQERTRFYTELFECVEGAAQLGTLAPVSRLLDEWQATAAVHADPVLAGRLRRPVTEDRGAVPRPTVP